jgi:(hydroxyamino)benzene mutase
VIPYAAAPRLGLSAHTLAALQSVLLLALGLLWEAAQSGGRHISGRVLAPCLLDVRDPRRLHARRVWGAGNETMPLAAGMAHGSPIHEGVIKVLAHSSAPTGIISFALILWGLHADRGDVRT